MRFLCHITYLLLSTLVGVSLAYLGVELSEESKAILAMLNYHSFPDDRIIGMGVTDVKLYVFLSSLWLYTGELTDVQLSRKHGARINLRFQELENRMKSLRQIPEVMKALCETDCQYSNRTVVIFQSPEKGLASQYMFAVIPNHQKLINVKTFHLETFTKTDLVLKSGHPVGLPVNLPIWDDGTERIAFLHKKEQNSYWWSNQSNVQDALSEPEVNHESFFRFGAVLSTRLPVVHLFLRQEKFIWSMNYSRDEIEKINTIEDVYDGSAKIVKQSYTSVFHFNEYRLDPFDVD